MMLFELTDQGRARRSGYPHTVLGPPTVLDIAAAHCVRVPSDPDVYFTTATVCAYGRSWQADAKQRFPASDLETRARMLRVFDLMITQPMTVLAEAKARGWIRYVGTAKQ